MAMGSFRWDAGMDPRYLSAKASTSGPSKSPTTEICVERKEEGGRELCCMYYGWHQNRSLGTWNMQPEHNRTLSHAYAHKHTEGESFSLIHTQTHLHTYTLIHTQIPNRRYYRQPTSVASVVICAMTASFTSGKVKSSMSSRAMERKRRSSAHMDLLISSAPAPE